MPVSVCEESRLTPLKLLVASLVEKDPLDLGNFSTETTTPPANPLLTEDRSPAHAIFGEYLSIVFAQPSLRPASV